MTVYRLQGSDGKVHRFEGPAGLSAQQVEQMAAHALSNQPELDKQQRQNPVSAADALVRGAANGATFGWDEPVTAAINSVLPLDKITNPNVRSVWDPRSTTDLVKGKKGDFFSRLADAYKTNLAIENRTTAADQAAHPLLRVGGQVAGTVAGSILAARALAAAKVPIPAPVARVAAAVAGNPWARGAVEGGVTGAVTGAGNARPGTRVQGALVGAAIGAPTGAITAGTVANVAPLVQRYVNAFAGKGTTQEALSQITGALQKLGYDVTSPKGALALKTQLKSMGVDASLADLGAATRGRAAAGLRTVSDAQQPGIDAILRRQAGSPDRLTTAITDNVAPRTDVHGLTADIIEQRAKQALPLRAASMQAPNPAAAAPVGPEQVQNYLARPEVGKALASGGAMPPMVPPNIANIPGSPKLQALVQLPQFEKAVQGAAVQARDAKNLATVLGRPTDHLPEFPEGDGPLDMNALDHVKKYMDKVVSAGATSPDAVTRAATYAEGGPRDARDVLKAAMIEHSPEYGQYLQSYADHSSLLDALNTGRGGAGTGLPGYARMDPEAIAAHQAAASPAEQELARVGYARALDDTVQNAKGVPSRQVLATPNDARRLAAAGVPAANAQDLSRRVNNENTYSLLTNIAKRAAGANSDSGEAAPLGAVFPVNPANHVSWVGLLLNKATGAVNLNRNATINEEVLPRLLAQDPATIDATIAELTKQGNLDAAKKVALARFASKAAIAASSSVGSPTTFQGQ